MFENNPVRCGRDGWRAGQPWFLLSAGEQEKSGQFTPDKLFCDRSASESPPEADAQEITAGAGAADRLVLYYHTDYNSCFTTPALGFKECWGGPAPVLKCGQSSTGTRVVGASLAQLPGHQGTRRLPVSQLEDIGWVSAG